MAMGLDRFDTPQSYIAELQTVLARLHLEAVEAMTDYLVQAWSGDAAVYVFGNGGSAALASHWACDFAKGTADVLPGERRLRVISLVDNAALVSAWANDLAYDQIFAQQLDGAVRAGDIAIAISGSGNSPNVLRGLETARGQGAVCLGLSGFQGGKMRAMCDEIIVVPSDSMQIIEDVHVSLCHTMFLMVRRSLSQHSRLSHAAGAR